MFDLGFVPDLLDIEVLIVWGHTFVVFPFLSHFLVYEMVDLKFFPELLDIEVFIVRGNKFEGDQTQTCAYAPYKIGHYNHLAWITT